VPAGCPEGLKKHNSHHQTFRYFTLHRPNSTYSTLHISGPALAFNTRCPTNTALTSALARVGPMLASSPHIHTVVVAVFWLQYIHQNVQFYDGVGGSLGVRWRDVRINVWCFVMMCFYKRRYSFATL
jgi:hypothetical protein